MKFKNIYSFSFECLTLRLLYNVKSQSICGRIGEIASASGWHIANKGALREFFARNSSRRLIHLNEQKYSGQVSSGWQQRAPTIHERLALSAYQDRSFFPFPPLYLPLLFPFALCAPVQTGRMVFWSWFLQVNPAPLFQVKCFYGPHFSLPKAHCSCQHFEFIIFLKKYCTTNRSWLAKIFHVSGLVLLLNTF